MAHDIKVTLYTSSMRQDALGQPTGEPIRWRDVWCEATYSGGSRKTYAGRLVSEYQVVLSTRWRDGIESCRFVEVDGRRYVIDSIVPEGRRYKAHIIYINDGRGYEE